MRLAVFISFFVIFKCESAVLWNDVSCDMSPENLSNIYEVERRTFEMEVPGYSEYFAKQVELFGVSFIPSFVLVTNLVKEVSLFHEYKSPLTKQLYDEILEYHLTKYGEPTESTLTKGYSYRAKWERENIEVHLKIQSNRKNKYYQYPKGVSIRFLCSRAVNKAT